MSSIKDITSPLPEWFTFPGTDAAFELQPLLTPDLVDVEAHVDFEGGRIGGEALRICARKGVRSARGVPPSHMATPELFDAEVLTFIATRVITKSRLKQDEGKAWRLPSSTSTHVDVASSPPAQTASSAPEASPEGS